MKRLLLFGTGMVVLCWFFSFVWLAGYRSGYDEGSGTAWAEARTAFLSQEQTQLAYEIELEPTIVKR